MSQCYKQHSWAASTLRGLISHSLLPKGWVKELVAGFEMYKWSYQCFLNISFDFQLQLMVTVRERKNLQRRQVLGFNSILTEDQGILQNCCSQKADFAFKVLVCSIFKVRYLHSFNSSLEPSIIWHSGLIYLCQI